MASETSSKKLYRSRSSKMIAGVCSGVAHYFAIDITLVRVIWLLATLWNGFGALLYIVSLVLMPENPDESVSKKTEQKKPENAGLIVGIGLVILGFMFLFRQNAHFYWIFDWPWFDFFPFGWDLIWPILLILFGTWHIWHNQYKVKTPANMETAAPKTGVREYKRSKKSRMLAGVCGGLARYWNIDVTLVRIGIVILSLITHVWVGLLAYIIVIIAVPEENK